MTSPAATSLLTDVNAVLDELEARFPGAPVSEERRAQLAMLVDEVCQRHGRTYPEAAVSEVIEALMQRTAQPLAVMTPGRAPRVPWTARAQQTLGRWTAAATTWWRTQTRARQRYLQLTGMCVGAATLLTFLPWSTLIKAPFLLAMRAPTLYALLFWSAMAAVVVGWFKAGKNNDKAFFHFIGGCLLTAIGGGGGLVAYYSGHGLDDVHRFQNNEAPAVIAALEKSMGTLPGGASFPQIMGEVQKNLQSDPRVNTRILDLTENDDVQAMELHYSFNQDECAQLRAHPNRYFVVATVNDQPVNPETFTCPSPWDNQVTVRSNVAWASGSMGNPNAIPPQVAAELMHEAHAQEVTPGMVPPLPSDVMPPLPSPSGAQGVLPPLPPLSTPNPSGPDPVVPPSADPRLPMPPPVAAPHATLGPAAQGTRSSLTGI